MLTLLIVPFFNFDIRLVNAYNPNDCHFAQAYSPESLFSSSTLQEEFLLQASWWQGVFARNGLAIELASGLTNLGLSFDVDTWTPNYWTFIQEKAGFIRNGDAMSEAVHLALTAAALNGDRFAREFFRSSQWPGWTIDDYLLDQLQRKIRTYNNFAEQYPGYGGYWPRLDVVHRSDLKQDPEAMLHTGGFGHWVWSLIAVTQV